MTKIIPGSVIEIFLEDINRYVYVKYIDNRYFNRDILYPFQFRIFNEYFLQPIDVDLDFSNLLISPLHLKGFKELLTNNSWTIIGKQPVSDADKNDHHYKMAWPPNLIADFEDVNQWRVIKDLNNINEGIIVPYEKCTHLEYAESLEGNYLKFRILLEFMKENDRLMELDKSKWDKFDHILFKRYTNMPIYRQVPLKHKGRLIP